VKAELLIRPGFNDHDKIADVLMAGPRRVDEGGPPFERLVLDAQLAARRPQFAHAAEKAGVPVLVDPLTFLGQGRLQEDDAWLRMPFANLAQRMGSVDIDAFTDAVIQFQVEHRATMIVPPYFYAGDPQDELGSLNINLLRSTGRYLAAMDIDLPVVPVVCGRLQSFSTEMGAQGIDKYLSAMTNLNVEFIALCLSPMGSGDEGRAKLLSYFRTARRLSGHHDVVAWRQGVYGPALVAAGLRGYESGIGTREQCDIRRTITSRGKRDKEQAKKGGGPTVGVLLEAFNRSVTTKVADVIMEDDPLRARLMCMDETCCPDGHESTLLDRRGHALRTRSRQLRILRQQPIRWGLYNIERNAYDGATAAKEANKLLNQTDLKERIKAKGFESLVQAVRTLREEQSSRDVA
jgi:hypothetical protein